VLASRGQSVAAIMAASAVLTTIALGIQTIGLRSLLRARTILPSYESQISKDLLRFGVFTWIIAASGVAFSQADRLIGGASLGAAAVVSYALCSQLSLPVYGLTAASLHFLLPYMASRQADVNGTALKRTLLIALLANITLVLTGAGLLLLLSDRLLHLLANEELARASAPVLPYVLAGSTLLALSVTGSYAMVALGRVRSVALLNVAACAVMVVFMASSLRGLGVMAIASGRIAFALIALCVYIPLAKKIRLRTSGLQYFESAEAVEEA
jgi:O-antigen/teichoic acid export membrane protein